MEEMISEKKDRFEGSSSSSYSKWGLVESSWRDQGRNDVRFACWSHKAESRMSASLIVPFELEYMKRLQWEG
jgi:hypothetical protein